MTDITVIDVLEQELSDVDTPEIDPNDTITFGIAGETVKLRPSVSKSGKSIKWTFQVDGRVRSGIKVRALSTGLPAEVTFDGVRLPLVKGLTQTGNAKTSGRSIVDLPGHGRKQVAAQVSQVQGGNWYLMASVYATSTGNSDLGLVEDLSAL